MVAVGRGDRVSDCRQLLEVVLRRDGIARHSSAISRTRSNGLCIGFNSGNKHGRLAEDVLYKRGVVGLREESVSVHGDWS